jgi:hypothetical protein
MLLGMNPDDAIEEFRRRAGPLVAVSDQKGLKALFRELSTAARMGAGEDQAEAKTAMDEELRRIFFLSSQQVKRGRFDDLR